jgi:hypothetical protein
MTLKSDDLMALVRSIHSLPFTVHGKFEENHRVLLLTRRRSTSELQLRLPGRDYPLLKASIVIPRDPDIPPAVSSVASRQERYLAAMISWALKVFSSSTPIVLTPSPVRPLWKRQLKVFISAAANDSGTTARAYFREKGYSLDELDDSEKALDAAYYLRDSGKAIHIDWKKDESLVPLCIDLLIKIKLHEAAKSLVSLDPTSEVEIELSNLQAKLSEAGLCINQIETYDDSHLYFITTNCNTVQALGALSGLGAAAAPAS